MHPVKLAPSEQSCRHKDERSERSLNFYWLNYHPFLVHSKKAILFGVLRVFCFAETAKINRENFLGFLNGKKLVIILKIMLSMVLNWKQWLKK